MKFTDRLRHAWNAFTTEKNPWEYQDIGMSYNYRPDRLRYARGNDQSFVTTICNRIAMDAAAIDVRHVRVNEDNYYLETIHSNLNNCLSVEANIDQTNRAFIQDVVMSLLDEGVVAIVPTDTTFDPYLTGSYDVLTMRTGQVIQWFPKHVKVRLYNEQTGKKEEITLPKSMVGIVENPLYSVMNETNSTMQRLVRKLSLLDVVDEQASSGKLDLIIQLPYVIKTETRQQQAEKRRKDIEQQLAGSKYGIAYTDGTERITQLNRPVENNLMSQIEYLTNLLLSQLGLTQEILNGTANETTMLNYYNRTIQPIMSAVIDEMKRKFLTKTARTQHQSIMAFRDPFKMVPVSNIAEIADKFTRNEILSSNEVRQIIGMKPSDNPKADELSNKNMPVSEQGGVPAEGEPVDGETPEDSVIDELLSNMEGKINEVVDGYTGEEEEDEEDDTR